jgi:cytidine deaminase
MSGNRVDWDQLKALARRASEAAYAPYSGYRVGAVVVDGSGGTYSGCNVENASLGLTTCAERNALAAAVLAGAEGLHALVVYSSGERPWPPCGACRQFMSELMRPDAVVRSCCDSGFGAEWTVASLLPDAFRLPRS